VSDSSDVNPNTGLPHSVSLGDVLDQIRLAPHEIASFLATLASWHQGTAQAELSNKLLDAASAALNPKSYGLSVPTPAAPPAPASPSEPPVFKLSGASAPAPVMATASVPYDTSSVPYDTSQPDTNR
jgi:hypothetical protein